MLRDRVVSAALAIAILVPVLAFGGVVGVTVVVAVFGTIAAWELSRNLTGLKTSPGRELTLILCLGLATAFHAFSIYGVLATVVWFPLVVLVCHLMLYNTIERSVESATQMILVPAYVVIPLAHAILLRRLDMGMAWVFFVLVVVSLGDAGAYFAGKYYGRHHFSKRVSPRKTVEGLAGGVAGNLLGMLVMAVIFPGLPSLAVLVQITLLLAIVAPLGDLTASVIKRRLEIKDFGFIMPGHGGVLDRADALIPAFPALYYFLILIGGSIPK